ncbi:MAG: hypothetical protein PVF07_02365 [Thiogranum sp.]|jgi:RNA polymerase sigma-70 factor (ECF subfamily)
MPDTAASQLETVTRVRRAVAAPPFDQRRVLSLVDLEGFAYREVVRILDIPVGSTVMAAFTRFARRCSAPWRRWPVASRRSQCR